MEKIASQNQGVLVKENFYDDLIGLVLQVPCSSWDQEEGAKCWGEDYASKFTKGVIKKVTLYRRSNKPKFEIHFPDKPYQNTFVGFDMDYVMSYSEDVPLRYHKLKAELIVKLAKKAETAMLSEASNEKKKSPEEIENSCTDSEHEEDVENLKYSDDIEKEKDNPKSDINSKKRKIGPALKGRGARKKEIIKDDSSIDGESSDEASDNDGEEDHQMPELWEDDMKDDDVEGNDISHFRPHLWKLKY
jgi:hypothetical protein